MIVSLLVSGVLISLTGFNIHVFELVLLGTLVWAAFDSKKLELNKYKSGLSYSSVVIFFLIAFFWIITFPWYLHVRYKINNGLAELKSKELDQETENSTSYELQCQVLILYY